MLKFTIVHNTEQEEDHEKDEYMALQRSAKKTTQLYLSTFSMHYSATVSHDALRQTWEGKERRKETTLKSSNTDLATE
jgi:hypothetical protein